MTINDSESGIALVAKLAPSASVTVASVLGMPVSDLLLWATLLYTLLMISQKAAQMIKALWIWLHKP